MKVRATVRRDGSDGPQFSAIDEYRTAIRLQSALAHAHTKLVDALQGKGHLAGAIAEYCAAIHLQPHLPLAHYNLGNALSDKDDFDEALAEYHWQFASGPTSPGPAPILRLRSLHKNLTLGGLGDRAVLASDGEGRAGAGLEGLR